MAFLGRAPVSVSVCVPVAMQSLVLSRGARPHIFSKVLQHQSVCFSELRAENDVFVHGLDKGECRRSLEGTQNVSKPLSLEDGLQGTFRRYNGPKENGSGSGQLITKAKTWALRQLSKSARLILGMSAARVSQSGKVFASPFCSGHVVLPRRSPSLPSWVHELWASMFRRRLASGGRAHRAEQGFDYGRSSLNKRTFFWRRMRCGLPSIARSVSGLQL